MAETPSEASSIIAVMSNVPYLRATAARVSWHAARTAGAGGVNGACAGRPCGEGLGLVLDQRLDARVMLKLGAADVHHRSAPALAQQRNRDGARWC